MDHVFKLAKKNFTLKIQHKNSCSVFNFYLIVNSIKFNLLAYALNDLASESTDVFPESLFSENERP